MSADQISIGIGDKRDIQPWRSRKTYCANEEVETGFALYIALVDHVSTVFATDLAAGKWIAVGGGGGGASPTIQTLTGGDGATNISWDYSLGYNAKVTFSGYPGVRTLDTPTNVSNGDYRTLIIDNGGFSGMTLVVSASFKVVNGEAGAISITGTANAIDVISWVYDGTNFLVSFGLNFT